MVFLNSALYEYPYALLQKPLCIRLRGVAVHSGGCLIISGVGTASVKPEKL